MQTPLPTPGVFLLFSLLTESWFCCWSNFPSWILTCLNFYKARHGVHMTQALILQGVSGNLLLLMSGDDTPNWYLPFLLPAFIVRRCLVLQQPFSFYEVICGKKKGNMLRIEGWKYRKKSGSLVTSLKKLNICLYHLLHKFFIPQQIKLYQILCDLHPNMCLTTTT